MIVLPLIIDWAYYIVLRTGYYHFVMTDTGSIHAEIFLIILFSSYMGLYFIHVFDFDFKYIQVQRLFFTA